MDLRPVFYVIGILLSTLAISMVLPLLVDLGSGNPDWKVFFFCAMFTLFFGGALIVTNTGFNFEMTVRQAFLLTGASWIVLAAFAALPDGTVETLLMPENKDKLTAILTYHVVPAKVMSSDIAGKKAQVMTVQGDRLSVDARNGVKVNGAKVTAADIAASNGVIHVIDKVLIPAGD